MGILFWVVVILAGLALLTVVILIHEIGHFWAARWMKVRIEEFGIGIPPRMLTLGERNGVKYTLNWLPLGGFVRMAGEEDPTIEGSLASKKPWQRAIVLSAGSLMNLLLAFLLFTGLAMYGREEPTTEQIGIYLVEPDSPAAGAGLQPGDIFVQVNDRPVTPEEDLIEVSLNQGYTITLVLDRGGQYTTTSLIPRRNPPRGQGAMGVRKTYYYEAPLLLSYIEEDSLAEQAGLQVGDRLVAIDGRRLKDSLEFEAYTTELARKASLGGVAGRLALRLARGETGDIDGVLRQPVTLTVTREGQALDPITMPYNPNSGWPMGINYVETEWRTYPLGRGLAEGGRETLYWTLLIPRTVSAMIRTSIAPSELSGPVGMVYLTGVVVERGGLYSFLRWMAIISVNLFVVNLFPIPAFDGGRLVFVFLEWILRGRRVPPRWEAIIHLVGFLLLLGFALYITYFDIARIVQSTGGG